MDEETDTEDGEENEPQRQPEDGAPVAKKIILGNAPAVEKQERRYEQEKEDLRVQRDVQAGEETDRRPEHNCTTDRGSADGRTRDRASLITTARRRAKHIKTTFITIGLSR